jgi:2-polyprenyl-6-methoxyphenol hydroxylase-like FAD-dependent oxidoreductase
MRRKAKIICSLVWSAGCNPTNWLRPSRAYRRSRHVSFVAGAALFPVSAPLSMSRSILRRTFSASDFWRAPELRLTLTPKWVPRGDAAHLFTPTGGLGYNTAVEDAVNLGWKLAAVLKGWGGPALLKSYEIERQALARRNTTTRGVLQTRSGCTSRRWNSRMTRPRAGRHGK